MMDKTGRLASIDREVPMRLGLHWGRLAETITRILEDHKFLSICLFSLFYFLGACGKASSKPFWFDELFSWHVAKLASLSEIWDALNEGIDPNPPLSYFLIRASHWVLGPGEVATRLPFLIGFWLALLFLLIFISKRCGILVSYISILFLCLSASYGYAFEARPYAFVLACCCASLLCWQLAIEGRVRRLALLGLSVSLGVALFSHFYAILLFVPVAIGEAYRSFRSRKIDWPIWVSMAAGASVLLPLVPMMLKLREYSEFYYAKPTWREFLESINWFFRDPVLMCLYVVVCFIGVLRAGYLLTPNEKSQSANWNMPSHELIATFSLISLPAIGFVFAKLVTNAFLFRYFLPTAIGIALGLAFRYKIFLKDRLWVATLLLISLLSVFIARQTTDVRGLVSKKPDSFGHRLTKSLSGAGDNDPIVISDGVKFPQYLHYVLPNLRSRLYYLIDPRIARQNNIDTLERSLSALRKRVPMGVEDYRSFLSSHDHFYLCGPVNLFLLHLPEDEFQIKLRKIRGNTFLEVFVESSLSGKAVNANR